MTSAVGGPERSAAGTPPNPDPCVVESERIEALLDELQASAPPELWQRVEELVERLCGMYGEGLRRMLTELAEAGALDDVTAERLSGDELVASLFVLHDLHPERGRWPRTTADRATHDAPLVQIERRKVPTPPSHDAVRCELCGAFAGGDHAHVVDREQRSLLCACRACALLFERKESGRYRTVPRRVLVEPGLSLTPARLASLGVPVQLAFLFFHSAQGRWVALYPSPAGPTETVLDEGAMDPLLADSALARALEPDVEALLVYGRLGAASVEAFLAPIDDCYDLVGLVRKSWRGVSGGDEARRDIEAFFRGLRLRARPLLDDARDGPGRAT